jgi:hypothetical protein
MTEVVEKLQEARALIERGWCKFYGAKTAKGSYVDPESRYAVAWCAYGALIRVDPGERLDLLSRLYNAFPPEMLGEDDLLGDYNDDPKTTKEDILSLYDRAIAKAKDQGT